jgi:hypothetical protein
VSLEKVNEFETSLLEYFRGKGAALREKLVAAKSFKGLEDEFKAACQDFKSTNWAG